MGFAGGLARTVDGARTTGQPEPGGEALSLTLSTCECERTGRRLKLITCATPAYFDEDSRLPLRVCGALLLIPDVCCSDQVQT